MLINKEYLILAVNQSIESISQIETILNQKQVRFYHVKSCAQALKEAITKKLTLLIINKNIFIDNNQEKEKATLLKILAKNIPIICLTDSEADEKKISTELEEFSHDFLREPFVDYVVKNKLKTLIELRLHKNEAEELQAKTEATLQELKRTTETRNEFISIASHELKTPLSNLKLEAQIRMQKLKEHKMSSFTEEKLMGLFSSDNNQIDCMTKLINDMLDVSVIDSGKLYMHFETFDLCELLRKIIKKNINQFVTYQNEVVCDFEERLLVEWDKFRIEQVVTNLLNNAMRYGAQKPIHISVKDDQRFATVAVKDHGIGIAKEHHEKIFLKFERVNRRNLGGLGLGLFIVKQIIEEHNGTIQLISETEKGSTFKFCLPISRKAV